MRCRGIASVVLLLLVALLPMTAMAANNSSQNSYFAWAVKSSKELDATWNRITSTASNSSYVTKSPFASSTSASSISYSFKGSFDRSTKSKPMRSISNGKNSITISGNYTHSGRNNVPFLPLSTRKRSGATRGSGVLRNPARAHLATPYKRLRPANSSIQMRRISSGIRGYRRPSMRSINIMSRGRYKRVASRPSYRAARPRKFKSIF